MQVRAAPVSSVASAPAAFSISALPEDHWDLRIRPLTNWLDLHLADVWHYRDLLWMFVRRDFVAVYKQTILGPLWFFIQPLLTTLVFTTTPPSSSRSPSSRKNTAGSSKSTR
jgi:lipopolysaccharide transport system permease protein